MASEAQIKANQRNSKLSTGPKSDRGKSISRGNALKHGNAAFTIMPVLPQEDPQELLERIQQMENSLQPQNNAERLLVHQAARLSYAIESAERMENAHMAGRVYRAARNHKMKFNPRQRTKFREAARRLLYITAPEQDFVDKQPPWGDDPWMFVRELEDSAEGCRWLLERWEEYRNLLDHKVNWTEGIMVRFIRLLGSNLKEALYDPAINAVFLAWDVLIPKYASEEWDYYKLNLPRSDPAYNHRLNWHDIAPRPSSPEEAWASLYATVNKNVDRLKELLAQHEAFELGDAEDPASLDRAAMDCSRAFERHRRSLSAKRRELLRTLDTLCKMRKAELGIGKGGTIDRNRSSVASDTEKGGEPAPGECQAEEKAPNEANLESMQPCFAQDIISDFAVRERSQSGAAGDGSQPVVDDATSNISAIVQQQETRTSHQVAQADSPVPSPADAVITPQKAPNEANLKSTQNTIAQEIKPVAAVRERSQSGAVVAVPGAAGSEGPKAMAVAIGSGTEVRDGVPDEPAPPAATAPPHPLPAAAPPHPLPAAAPVIMPQGRLTALAGAIIASKSRRF